MMKTITPTTATATATAVPCTPQRMIVVTTDWMVVVVEDDENTTKENDENDPTTAEAMRFTTDPVIPVGSPLWKFHGIKHACSQLVSIRHDE